MLKNNNYWLIGQKEIADYLQVTTQTVSNYCRAKKIPASFVGGKYRIMSADLDQWAKARRR